MFKPKTFTKHPPHATKDEEPGPPNAERRGVRFILFNSTVLAVIALGILGTIFWVFY